eukprot:scaffold5448_cov59-Phaeocystis_antarctica.AAC.1
MCLAATRQGAGAFNQPLSLDTSSVTNMRGMFQVRTPARAVLCPVGSSVHAACTATPPPCALAPPTPRVALHVPRCDSAGRVGVQPAAELRHVQRHEHGLHVLRAHPARVPCPVSSWFLRAPLRAPPHRPHASSRLLAPRVAIHVPRCDSADSGGVQPAAEPRHVQRHEHGGHV